MSAEGEPQEFYATESVVNRANTLPRHESSRITYVLQPEHTVSFDLGAGRQTLTRVVPEFSAGLPGDACRDMATAVLDDEPAIVVFRPPRRNGGAPITVTDVNADDGREVTGMHYLARAMAAALTDDTVADPQWAASAAEGDPRGRGGPHLSTVLPGRDYGSALSVAPANAARRARMDDIAIRTGTNEYAQARLHEAWLTSTIAASGEDETLAVTNFAREDGLSHPTPWGYTFAAVVAESEDGQAQVTLENYSRRPDLERAMREAVELNLQRYAGGFRTLRQRLLERAGDDHAQARLALLDALGEIERLREVGRAPQPDAAPVPDNTDAIERQIRAACDAMLAILRDALPGPRGLWHMRMYSGHRGQTFHEAWANLQPRQDPPRLVNPLTVVVLGGRTGMRRPFEIPFDQGSATIGPRALNSVAIVARQIVRQAIWWRRNGLDLPTIVISGHGGTDLGRRRAEAVAQALRPQVEAILDGLGDARADVVAADIQMVASAATVPGNREDVDVSIVAPTHAGGAVHASAHARRAAEAEDTFQNSLAFALAEQPQLNLSPADVASRLDELAAIVPGATLEGRDDVLHSAGTRRRLGALARHLSADQPYRNALLSAVHDLLLSTALAVVPYSRSGRRPLQILSPDALDAVLAGIARDVAEAHDPFSTGRTLADIGYLPTERLVQRLARLSLLNLVPDARRILIADALFAQLLSNPHLGELMIAPAGRASFQNAGAPAAVDHYVLTLSSMIPVLLLVGRRVAGDVENQAREAGPAFDRPESPQRTFRQLMRQHAADARTSFDKIEQSLTALLDPARGPVASGRVRSEQSSLVSRWRYTMQKLSVAVEPDVHARQQPLLTPLRIPNRPGANTMLAAAATGRGQIGRRTTRVDAGAYAHHIGRSFMSPLSIEYRPLVDAATNDRQVASRFWNRVRAGGGLLVGPSNNLTVLGAVTRDGVPVFELVNPTASGSYVIELPDIVGWAAQFAPPKRGPAADAPLVISGALVRPRVSAAADTRPWSADELSPLVRVHVHGPNRGVVWFDSPGSDRELELSTLAQRGRPADGELWVLLDGRGGRVFLDGRDVPPDVLADVLVQLQLPFTWIVALISEVGQGDFVKNLRASLVGWLTADKKPAEVGVTATKQQVGIGWMTGTAFALNVRSDSDASLHATSLSTFEELGPAATRPVPVSFSAPPGADPLADHQVTFMMGDPSTEPPQSRADAGWTVAELDSLVDSGRVHVFWAEGGGVHVLLPRDEAEWADGDYAAAVRAAVVPEGFGVAAWVHGEGGVAYLFKRPLPAGVFAQWLADRGIGGDVYVPGCELLTPDRLGGFGAELRTQGRRRVRATETLGWLDPATGVTIAAPVDAQGQPLFTADGQPAGGYHDLPAEGGLAVPVPRDPRVPDQTAQWRKLLDSSAPVSSAPVSVAPVSSAPTQPATHGTADVAALVDSPTRPGLHARTGLSFFAPPDESDSDADVAALVDSPTRPGLRARTGLPFFAPPDESDSDDDWTDEERDDDIVGSGTRVERWYLPRGVELLGVGRYAMSDLGRFRFQDGLEMAAGGWFWHHDALVHPVRGLTLSPATGVVRRVGSSEMDTWPTAGNELVVSADILGLRVTRTVPQAWVSQAAAAPGGWPPFVPRRMLPVDDLTPRTDPWTAALSADELDMVRVATRRAARAARLAGEPVGPLARGAAAAAEWRLRHESALATFTSEEDGPRTLPPSFGAVNPQTGRREFGLGHHTRLWWLGDSSLMGPAEVAAVVVAGLPDGLRELLADPVRDAVLRKLQRYDLRLFVQAMLEQRPTAGHVERTPGTTEGHFAQQIPDPASTRDASLVVTVGGREYRVAPQLDLGDFDLATHVPPADAERVPPGQEWHVLVNADHEVHNYARRSVTDNRTMSLGISKAWSFFGGHFQVTAVAGPNASSGRSYEQGFDWVSASKRFFDVSGMPAYFDFGDASVRTAVSVAGSPTPPTAGRVRRVIRAEFARELAPLLPRPQDNSASDAGPGDAVPRGLTGVLPPQPITLDGSQWLGLTRTEYEEALANPAAHPDRRAQADALTQVLAHVFHQIEAAPGLEQLRGQVTRLLNSGDLPLPETAQDEVDWWVSEPAFIRMIGDIRAGRDMGDLGAVGAVSPFISAKVPRRLRKTLPKRSRSLAGRVDYGSHITLMTRLVGAQAVSIDPVPLKEEGQRFVSDHDDSTESGGVGLDLTVRLQGLGGDPTADSGVAGNAGFEIMMGASQGAARASRSNQGSGEVRLFVYNGPSVRYRMLMDTTAVIATNMSGVDASESPRFLHEVYFRVPIQQRARFEALLVNAMSHPDIAPHQHPGGIPADQDPTPSDPQEAAAQAAAESVVRYPTATMESGHSPGFTVPERLAGAAQVLPRILAMLAVAEAELGLDRRDKVAQARLVRQLSSRYTEEALMNLSSRLFQRGGLRGYDSLALTRGMEHVVGQVKAVRNPVPYQTGRVAKAKVELMPGAAFAGAGGGDQMSSSWTLAGRFVGQLRINKLNLTLGPAARLGYSSALADSTDVSQSGFQIHAKLYHGAAQTFDYGTHFEVGLDVTLKRPWSDRVVAWAKAKYAALRGRPTSRPTRAGNPSRLHVRRVHPFGDGRADDADNSTDRDRVGAGRSGAADRAGRPRGSDPGTARPERPRADDRGRPAHRSGRGADPRR